MPVMCAGGVCVSCALVSVSWVCPGIWGERRLDLVFFCVCKGMSGVLVLWLIGGVCLVALDFP